MTSGEWDLRALKALEEEELASFQAINETELLQKIPPPPQLPTIDELCGDLTSSEFGSTNTLNDNLLDINIGIPLPPSILTTSSLSAKLLGSPTKGLKGNIKSKTAIATTPKLGKKNCCSSTLQRTGSLNRSRKFNKNQQQRLHQPHCNKNRVADSSLTISNLSSFKTNSESGSSCNSLSSGGNTTHQSVAASLGLDSNEMMTMMMFLQSTAPPEVSAAAVTDSNTNINGGNVGTNPLSPFMMCTSKAFGNDDNDDDDDLGGAGNFSNKKLNANKRKNPININCVGGKNFSKISSVSGGNNCGGGGGSVVGISPCQLSGNCNTSKDVVIDYELEDHIKHCSCSCNHMGYGNSMDYQTTGFGGLPDVTEHSNIKRSTSRQDSLSNSESGEIISLQKSKQTNSATKKSLKHGKKHKSSLSSSSSDGKHKKICIFSLSALTILVLCATIATIFLYQLLFMAPSRNSHDERMKIVRKILKEVPLIDGHNNLAWNVRKYAHNSLDSLTASHGIEQKTMWQRPQWSQTDIPRLKEGLVGGQIWSAYVPCEAQGLDAVQLALEQIDIIHRFTELHASETVLVTTSSEILQAHAKGLIASLIGIEGGHALGSSLGVLRSFHSLGARYLTLTHQCDITWAGSSSMTMEKGLTTFGKSVIKEMNRLGMLIDLSHSSDATCRDALEVTRAPIIFSHSVARALCNSSRNIPDDILRSVADNGGIIMVSFDSEYVSCGMPSTLHDVIAHIKFIRSIAGIEHIGIGAGYDGILPPIGLEDVSKYPILFATLLEDPNWSDEDLAKLAGKNFIRVLKSVENVRDYWKRADIQPVEITEPMKKSQCTYMSS